ncbi:MAG: hypothetical protein ETSY1_40770 [Candidatus Entotheonella factor]|uniref:MucR family transcriptional regulator n=1 Tax=Entotheonella factor TaxID=1429438 RepID=W4L4U6_ENTF1|nr:MAG: hypothetical protein ETSY1_40770 [Candidatus Entotheonella factor]
MTSLLQMAKDLVAEQIALGKIPPEETSHHLHLTHDTLQKLHRQEQGRRPVAAEAEAAERPADWKTSITKHAITCLECGVSLRQLSSRHLRVHDLDAKSYRLKYGIPSAPPLSSRQATKRRQELAQQIRPWEKAQAAARVAAKAPAKAKGTR